MSKINVQSNFVVEINNLRKDQQLFLKQIRKKDLELRRIISFENSYSNADREKLVSAQSQLYKEFLLQSKKLFSEQTLKLDQLEINYPSENLFIKSQRKSIYIDINIKAEKEIFKNYHFIRKDKKDKIFKLGNREFAVNQETYGTNDPYLIRNIRKKNQDQANETIKSIGLIGNIEIDSLISEIKKRHNKPEQVSAEAKSIEQQDFDKNSNVHLQNLKNDIYSLIELTSKAKTEREYNFIDDYIEKYIKQYNQIAKPNAQNTEIQKGGSAYNFIMNNSEDKIATIMRLYDMNQEQNNQANNLNLDISNLLKDAPPEFIKRIYSIQSKIEQKQKLNYTVDDVIDRFLNKLANIVGLGIKDKDIINLRDAMNKESIAGSIGNHLIDKTKIHEHPELNELKNKLNKFTNTKKHQASNSKNKNSTIEQSVEEKVKIISNSINDHRAKTTKHVPPNKPLPKAPSDRRI